MSKNPINWKARYLAAEKCAEFLTIERDGEVNRRIILENELRQRPTIEKIVEKEVLPKWYWRFDAVVIGGLCLLWWMSFVAVKRLQTPILQPYAVVEKGDDYYLAYKSFANKLDSEIKKLSICQDAWRQNEAKIKKLERRLGQ